MGWEYEGLFERDLAEEELDAPLAYAYWRSLPTAVKFGEMGYRTRTIRAGDRLEAEVYPIFGREDRGRLRAAKGNISRAAQKKLNNERSIRHLIRLVDANFGENDSHVALTYAGELPDPERVRKDIRNFLLRVRRAWERKAAEAAVFGRAWPELKYIYAVGGDEMPARGWSGKRPHIHLIMTGGLPAEDLIRIWRKGRVRCDVLQPNEEGLEGLARYFTKQRFDRPPKSGARMWAGSRNLKQPKVRTSDTKCSNARVRRIAPFVKCSVYHSDVVRGVYIRAVMRRL